MTSPQLDTSTLYCLLAERNPAALEYLYGYTRVLEGVLYRKFGHVIDDEDRKDIVADALLNAWQNGDRYDPRLASVKTWLVMVAVYQAREFLRRNGLGTSMRLDQIDPESLPQEQAIPTTQPQIGARMRGLMEQLPARRASVITLYYSDGRPVPEIARLLQITEAAVKSHLSHGRASLRALYQ